MEPLSEDHPSHVPSAITSSVDSQTRSWPHRSVASAPTWFSDCSSYTVLSWKWWPSQHNNALLPRDVILLLGQKPNGQIRMLVNFFGKAQKSQLITPLAIPFISKYIYKRSNSEWGKQKHQRTLGGIKGQNVDTDSWRIVCERFPSADVARLRRDKIRVLWSVATGGIPGKNLCSSTCRYIIECQIEGEASCTAARVGDLSNTSVSEHEKVFWKMMTLMMSWPVDVLRTTLQKTVPVLEGKVLGIYWSPRFWLKSFWT